MRDDRENTEIDTLRDDVAQHVIARAIALDTVRAAGMPITRLRDVALEAGISPQAFERALGELRDGRLHVPGNPESSPGFLRRLAQRLTGQRRSASRESEPEFWSVRGVFEATATNVIAFVAFWVPSLLLLSFLHSLGFFRSGALDTASVIVCTLLGLALAVRLRARPVVVILAVAAAGEVVNLFVDLVPISTHSGFVGSNAFGWLVAALLGVSLGIVIGRRFSRTSGDPAERAGAEREASRLPTYRDDRPSEGQPFLRLRLRDA
jgi:hypothetical protein